MTTVYVDGQDVEVENLTSEQVFYLLQCTPVRLTLEQLEEWREAAFAAGSDSADYGRYCCEH
jgi:hypothetical protein